MAEMAGRGASAEVRQAAAERRRQVTQLRRSGLTFEAIGKQLGFSRHIAYKHYRRALQIIPKAGVDELRKLEGERIADVRWRIYTELAGRPDPKFPNDPTKMIRPSFSRFVRLIGSLAQDQPPRGAPVRPVHAETCTSGVGAGWPVNQRRRIGSAACAADRSGTG